MRSRAVWVVVIGLAAMSVPSWAQQLPLSDPNTFVTESCTGDRGLVRTGRVLGNPADIAAARSISLPAFIKIAFQNASDPTKWPSKIAPTSLTTGEGILYRIDNLEMDEVDNCLDSIVVRFGAFVGVTQVEISGLFPSSACTTGKMKDVVEAAKTVFTDQLSVWGPDLWHNDFEKACQVGGEGKPGQRVSVVGYSFWDDSGGTAFAPVLRLAPMIAIIDTTNAPSDGSGGTGGGGGGGTPTPTTSSLAVILSDDVRATPVVMGNASSTTVLFQTFVSDTSLDPVTLSVTTDDDNLLASVAPPVINASGTIDGVVTITTTPTTSAGDHSVTITATGADGSTASATIFVTVICDPPFILGIDQPKGSAVSLGRPAILSVNASGSGPFIYQWFTGAKGLVNFPLAGGTSSTFTTSAINDTTSYWVRVTNACGSVDSQTVTVTVAPGAKPGANSRR